MHSTIIIIKCIGVAIFALIVFGFFRYVNKALNELKKPYQYQSKYLNSFGWVFFKHRKSGFVYAYNAVKLHLIMAQKIPNYKIFRRDFKGEVVNSNLDLQSYLFDKANNREFTFKTISRDEFMSVYNQQ